MIQNGLDHIFSFLQQNVNKGELEFRVNSDICGAGSVFAHLALFFGFINECFFCLRKPFSLFKSELCNMLTFRRG